MCGKWNTCFIVNKLLTVAVVRTYKHLPANTKQGIVSLANTFIHRLDRLNCRVQDTGVANHIRVCKINDNHIVFQGLDRVH